MRSNVSRLGRLAGSNIPVCCRNALVVAWGLAIVNCGHDVVEWCGIRRVKRSLARFSYRDTLIPLHRLYINLIYLGYFPLRPTLNTPSHDIIPLTDVKFTDRTDINSRNSECILGMFLC